MTAALMDAMSVALKEQRMVELMGWMWVERTVVLLGVLMAVMTVALKVLMKVG